MNVNAQVTLIDVSNDLKSGTRTLRKPRKAVFEAYIWISCVA